MSDIYKTVFDLQMGGPLLRQIGEATNLLRTFDRQVVETQKRLRGLSFGVKGIRDLEKLTRGIAGLKTVTAETAKVMKSDMHGAFAGVSSEIGGIKRALSELRGETRRFGGSRPGHGGSSVLDVLAMGPTHSGTFAGRNIEHSVVGGLLEANGELQRQINLYRLGGASARDVLAGRSAAYRSSTLVPDVGVAESMKLLRELSGATGDEAGSRRVLPDAAKAMSIMGAVTGRHSEEDMKRLFKFIELRGVAIDEHAHKIDPTKFGSELNFATKAMVAAQGLITSNDMLQFAKQAGSMSKGMSGDELFTTMLAAMEDMGGSRAGTSLTAVGRQFLGGIMTGSKAERLKQLGLLNSAGTHVTDQGTLKIDDPTKAVVGYDTLTRKGFGAFMEEVFRPALQAHGIGDRQKQNEELYRSVGTDTARRLMGLYLSGHEQVGIVAGRFNKAMGGAEGYDKIFGSGQDLQTSTKALSESLTTLKTALGDASGVAPALMGLAKGIAGLADTIKDRPALGEAATLGAMGSGAALLGYGALQTVKGFGLPAAAAELTTAAKMLQAASGGTPGGGTGSKGKLGLFGSIGAAFGLYGLAEAAQSNNVLAAPKASDGFWKNVLNFLDPGLAARVIGEGIKAPAVEAGKEAGKATTDGFKAEPFKDAGAAAGSSLLQGFLSVLGKLGGEGGVSGISFGGAGGLGGLIQKASFGGSALAVGSGTGLGHSASKAERAAYIKARALSLGIDPQVALRVAQSEGFNTFVGDYGTSFGDFQLHYGGSGIRGMNSMGEGDLFTRATGLSAKDPRNWKAATDWALKRARQNGWGAWHGAARAGIGNHQGIGTVAPQAMPAPTAAPPPPTQQMVQVHTLVNLDGKKMASVVTEHQAARMLFPKKAGGMDTHGTWRAPGTPVLDCA